MVASIPPPNCFDALTNRSSGPTPTTLSPRLSADAAEWHPPSFVAAAVENQTIPQQSEEAEPEVDVDAIQEQPSATVKVDAQQQPRPESVTPPSTPREDEGLGDGSTPLHAPTGFTPSETTEAVEPAQEAVEPAQEASIQEASVSTGIDNSTSIPEEVEEDAPPAEEPTAAEEGEAAVATAAAEVGTAVDEESSQSQAAGVPEATLENPEDRAVVVDPVEMAATTDLTTSADAGDTATPEPCVEKPAGRDAADGARGEKDATDATSNPTDDSSGSDPEDASGGYGADKGSGDNFFADKGDGASGGGILDDPKLRWGSIAAMAAIVLAFSLRRR